MTFNTRVRIWEYWYVCTFGQSLVRSLNSLKSQYCSHPLMFLSATHECQPIRAISLAFPHFPMEALSVVLILTGTLRSLGTISCFRQKLSWFWRSLKALQERNENIVGNNSVHSWKSAYSFQVTVGREWNKFIFQSWLRWGGIARVNGTFVKCRVNSQDSVYRLREWSLHRLVFSYTFFNGRYQVDSPLISRFFIAKNNILEAWDNFLPFLFYLPEEL